jgi:hypothetical protein
MKHGLSRDERRARARVVCAGVGLALAAAGGALWLARPARHDTWAGAVRAAELEPAQAPTVAVMAPAELPLYDFRGGRDADELGMALPDTTLSIPEGAMFEPGAIGAAESALHADAIVRHAAPFSPDRERDEEAAASRARRALARGARAGGADALGAHADDHNETVVKRASFRSCWEASPSASGKVNLEIVVDPARGVSVHPVAAPGIPDIVVSCVAARARSLPLRVPPDGGPRSFNVSSSYRMASADRLPQRPPWPW